MGDNSDVRILIVDDTLKNIQVLGTVLRKEGFQINVAQNGVQALKVVDTITPDLILLDVMMPEMDGFETCTRLKANERTAAIPVIFLTAKIEKEDVVKGFELGAVDYVTKPFNPTELLSRVNTHLTIRRLQQSLEQRVDELGQALKQIKSMQREHESFMRHELKNNIGPIMGYADMLMNLSGGLTDKQKKWAEKIVVSSRRMTHLIDDLKKLQDFERGLFDMEVEPCDLQGLLGSLVADLDKQFPAVTLVYTPGEDPLRVSANISLLEGVYRNVIKNALEHVADLDDPGERVVRVALGLTDGQVCCTVNNGGSPIPQALLETIFEKFNSTKRKKGGTGLGTTYAYLVTRAHGGVLTITSDEASGTTVTVQLPEMA